MALTATATHSSRKKIIDSLRMQNPSLIYKSPHKKNVFYTVRPKPEVEDVVSFLACTLGELRATTPRTIIFCRRYVECAQIYTLFQQHLNESSTDPPGAPNLVKYRLVDMYTKCTEPVIKEEIVSCFSDPNGKLRIVIATIAFGMGLDFPNVRQILHWGAAHDLESYIQETGRCGRDGYLASAVLFHRKKEVKNTSDAMMRYCENETVCRRKVLFRDFADDETVSFPCSLCVCCDVCKLKCDCEKCKKSVDLVSYAFTHC